MDTFQARLSILLDEYNGTDSDIAKGLNVSKQTISAWRSGTRSPKKPTIESVARYFNVNIPWLMGLDVERDTYYKSMIVSFDGLPAPETITTEERMLVQAYREATTEARTIAMETLSNHKKEEFRK